MGAQDTARATPAALMLQGTGSDVGKSLLVAGLARAFARRGLRVRPFKPQNMSNNAAVTVGPDGTAGEIGRAQALQARACGVAPGIDMNPVLLKPQTDIGAQVIVHGKVMGSASARDYAALKPTLLPAVLESFARLGADADLVLVEGAGSPAEVNLRAGDIANMGFAEAADVPVVLVADIDRGGVIASIVGTWQLLPESERARLAGVIVNKFRGDVRLFDGGLDVIARETGLRAFGVVPYFADARLLPAEDALALDARPAGPPLRQAQGEGRGADPRPHAERVEAPGRDGSPLLRIAVLALPRIANFDDFDPLKAEPDVEVTLVRAGEAVPGERDLVIIPGSKATIADLAFLRAQGWDIDVAAHARRGGAVLGLCGGYQMLGRSVRDPGGIEGPAGAADGLGLLDVETTLAGDKTLTQVAGRDTASGAAVRGYEIHMGRTDGPGCARPLLDLGGRPDGAVSADGRVMGCYLHGLFGEDAFRHAFLSRLRARDRGTLAYEAQVEAVLDRLADHLEAHLALDDLLAVARRQAFAP